MSLKDAIQSIGNYLKEYPYNYTHGGALDGAVAMSPFVVGAAVMACNPTSVMEFYSAIVSYLPEIPEFQRGVYDFTHTIKNSPQDVVARTFAAIPAISASAALALSGDQALETAPVKKGINKVGDILLKYVGGR